MYCLFIILFTSYCSIVMAADGSLTKKQDESFVFDTAKIASKFSNDSFTQRRLIVALTGIPDTKKTEEFVEIVTLLMTGISYGQDTLIQKLGEIDPKHYTKAFAQLVVALSPKETWGQIVYKL
jgi:hypothetical protein